MAFNKNQFLNEIILPTLETLGLTTGAELLLGTCAVESDFGTYLRQVKGPALGVFMVEPETHNDLWKNFLGYRPQLAERMRQIAGTSFIKEEILVSNLAYSCAVARVLYYRIPAPLPNPKDVLALAKYWKKYYNTTLGKGTPSHFMKKWMTYAEGA